VNLKVDAEPFVRGVSVLVSHVDGRSFSGFRVTSGQRSGGGCSTTGRNMNALSAIYGETDP
jgi:hypothetical protein